MRKQVRDRQSAAQESRKLDAVFILLILCIAFTSFETENISKTGDSGETSKSVKVKVETLAIKINAKGEVIINEKKVDSSTITENVEHWRLNKESPSVVVLANENASTEKLVNVIDAVRSADVLNVSVSHAIP